MRGNDRHNLVIPDEAERSSGILDLLVFFRVSFPLIGHYYLV
jgi:hypothetical protein